jgi:hypothetical protein
VPLDQYFEENAGKYVKGKIRNIDVQRITYEPGVNAAAKMHRLAGVKIHQ